MGAEKKDPSESAKGGMVSSDVAALLKRRIENGELTEGSRVPSEHQLARSHGLTRNQAREALRELEWEGLIVRRRGSGSYVARLNDRIAAIPPASPGTVALIFPQYLSRFSRGVFDGFMRHMAQAGRQTIAYNWQQEKAAELRLLRTLGESGVAGLVAWIEHDEEEVRDLVTELCERPFPIVLVDRYLRGVDTDYVASDNEAIGYRLTRMLLDKGHRRIGFVGLQKRPPSSVRERLQGYRRALEEAGITYDERIVGGDRKASDQSLAKCANAFMALPERPTAFVCIHDLVAKLLYDPLTQLGYKMPAEVEFAALDDGHVPEDIKMPMVQLRQQAQVIGAKSAKLLIERIGEPTLPPRQVRVAPTPGTDSRETSVEKSAVAS
ncbi:MAG: GntR family transcriptional regulator [Candidatus Hydrogenedentota bacterium]